MKKVDGFTRTWWLIQAFTGSFMSVLSIPELGMLINKSHRSFLDGIYIITIVLIMVLTGISVVIAGALATYNTIVSANEEGLNEKEHRSV